MKLNDGRQYNKVRVTHKQVDEISITHESGATHLRVEDLPSSVASRLGLSKAKAEEARVILENSNREAEKKRVLLAARNEELDRLERAGKAMEEDRVRQAAEALTSQNKSNASQQDPFAANVSPNAPRPSIPQPPPPDDDSAKIRELNTKIRELRARMIKLLDDTGAHQDGSSESEAVYKLAMKQVSLWQTSLDSLCQERDALAGKRPTPQDPFAAQGSGYLSKIEKEEAGVFILTNRAVIKVSNTHIEVQLIFGPNSC